MFDMRNRADRRQVLSVLGIILILSGIPAFLVLTTQVAADLFPGILAGIVLYAVVTCWQNVTCSLKGEKEHV